MPEFVMSRRQFAGISESTLALAWVTDALFCSDLTTGQLLTGTEMSDAIRAALAEHGGWDGCMRTVALAFIDDENQAIERQLWCRRIAVEAWESSSGRDARR
jgi:hypothetical protein